MIKLINFEQFWRRREKMSNLNNKKFMKPGRNNKEDRLNFVEFWAEFVKTHKDEEWSNQQNILINSVLKQAKQ